VLALIKAIDGFDPGRGTAFSSFALPSIVGALKRHYRDVGCAAPATRAAGARAARVTSFWRARRFDRFTAHRGAGRRARACQRRRCARGARGLRQPWHGSPCPSRCDTASVILGRLCRARPGRAASVRRCPSAPRTAPAVEGQERRRERRFPCHSTPAAPSPRCSSSRAHRSTRHEPRAHCLSS